MDENKEFAALDLEEQERLKKIEKLDENQGRKKIIFAGVTVFLIALFAFGTVFGAKYILSYEGTQELPKESTDFFADCEGADAVSAIDGYISDACDYASVKLDIRYHVSVPEEDIKVTADGVDGEKLMKFIRGSIEGKLSSIYSANDKNGAYGEDFSAELPVFDFDASDAKEATLKRNEEKETELLGHVSFDGCQKEEIASLPVYTVFDMDDTDAAINAAVEAFASDVAVSGVTVAYDRFDIDSFAENVTVPAVVSYVPAPVLKRIVYSRSCIVSFDAEFLGELAPYGKQQISMRVNVSEEYNFTHVKFDISQDAYFIEKGASDEINRRIVSDAPVTELKVEWTSSDPEVLSVDEKGFYKGRKISDKPVTVTGKYVYNGVEYTDSVLFYVREPVESVKLSEKELTMKVGEQAQLTPIVKPAKATFKDVYWFSTDENIVTVDENGNVSAVAPGEAGVYVITFDGNFKKTCTVTVTE